MHKIFANELLATLLKQDPEIQARFHQGFHILATKLCTAFESALIDKSSVPLTIPKLRAKLWIRYGAIHCHRCGMNFFANGYCNAHTGEPLLRELVNESIVDNLSKKTFPAFDLIPQFC